ncbi:metal ABC transporter permease [Peptostreptococcus anaerobius]|uniref:metal ABC transporter permease n=1 Tax=Peptostreptococcus anaerobius TaxID=1261 RepID=UPI0029031B28|nr:metal ABC transporter permease [Peptostreptococcus anaerobius]MDU1598730.1 metal ABC transporter permease [Peptostreptococcus anaerobius]MDU1682379.1 metal ABC transporter permease [Peptostreptococcus anaerobius]
MLGSQAVLLITSISCSLLGVFLVLRNLSMIADAISHSVLLGIVLAFFITKDLESPFLIISAGVFGVITVAFIELVGRSKRVDRSDAIGVVFPMFFSLAVILISRYARNAHIDTDVVLMGEVIFASLNSVNIGGLYIPVSFLRMGVTLILNLGFIVAFYRYLKTSSFDEEYAKLIGMPIGLIFYSFMTLTSITAVAAFDAVGSILVLSFFIAPAATAYLISKDLKKMLVLSCVFASITCLIGSYISIQINASMTGMCAVVGMVLFMLVLLVNKNGIVSRVINRNNLKVKVRKDMFIVHVGNHIIDGSSNEENRVDTIKEHLVWSDEELDIVTDKLRKDGLVEAVDGIYDLTTIGHKRYEYLVELYGLDS